MRRMRKVARESQHMSSVVHRVGLQEQFTRDGYVVIHELISPDELSPLLAESERLLARRDLIDINNLRCRWQGHCETGECRFDGFDPITDLSPPIERMARDPRVMEILQTILGEPACLFKDKLIYKPPGASGYGLHQDYIAWSDFPTSFVSLVMPLDVASVESGCTVIYPGRHREGCLSTADGDYHQLPMSCVDESTAVSLELEPGDIAVFSGFLPHRSDANRSDRWRRQLYFSYNALSDGGDRRLDHQRVFLGWLKEKYSQFDRPETYFD